MDEPFDSENFIRKIKEQTYNVAASTSNYCDETKNEVNAFSKTSDKSRNEVNSFSKTFDNCRVNNNIENNVKDREGTLLWNPDTKSFEVRQYFIPKYKDKAFQKNENFQKVINIDDQLLQQTFKNNSKRKVNFLNANDKYKRDEYFQKILDIKDQVLKSTATWFRHHNKHSVPDTKFKSKYKKYKAVSFNPEVQVIYMIQKKSNNEVHLRGVEVLNKEHDQQMRNYIMRSSYCKKKLLY